MEETPREPFLWAPGRGYDPAALRRMRARLPRPPEGLRDAWFLKGAPRIDGRTAIDDGWLSYWELRDALYDIASNACKRPAPTADADWFRFLLAQEIPGAMFGSTLSPLIEALATVFFILHPLRGETEPYPGFRRDALETLGRAIMDPNGWSGAEIRRGAVLRRQWRPGQGWRWDQPAGDLSASMFFCLKYLACAEIGPWLRSALDIEDAHWRAQLIAWFVGARDALAGQACPGAQLPIDGQPVVVWTDSNLLLAAHGRAAPFLPAANRKAALDAVAAFFDETSFIDWAGGVLADDELAPALGRTPWRFRELYLYVNA